MDKMLIKSCTKFSDAWKLCGIMLQYIFLKNKNQNGNIKKDQWVGSEKMDMRKADWMHFKNVKV